MNSSQTTNKLNPDELTDEIIEQIMIVRDTGKTNMFAINEVSRIAYEMDLFELVNFLRERKNRVIYNNFIMYGKKQKK